MAQEPEPTTDEVDARTVSSPQEDPTAMATAASTEGGLSDLLAASESKTTLVPDLKSPLSEEDFSAWDISHDKDAVSPQGAGTDAGALTRDAPTSLDAAILDTQESGRATEIPPTDASTFMETSEAPSHTLADGLEPMQPEPAQSFEAPVEAALTSSEIAEIPSYPASSDELSPQVHGDRQKDTPVPAEKKDDTEEPISEQPVLSEVLEPSVTETAATTVISAETTRIPEEQALPVEFEPKVDQEGHVIEDAVQSEPREQSDVKPDVAHVEKAANPEDHDLTIESEHKDDIRAPVIEEAVQSAAAHDPWTVETSPTQVESAETQVAQAEAAPHELNEPVVEKSPESDVHEPWVSPSEPLKLQSDADQALPVQAEKAPVNGEIIAHEDVKTAVEQDVDLGAPATQSVHNQLDPLQTAREEVYPVDNQGHSVEATAQPDVEEQSAFDVAPVEGNADGGNLWSNEAAGDVDSDGDDFFNQLKTQTKPIFAPPESESRFEEGVPLLDDTNPTSPPLPIPQRRPVDNPFGNDEEDGADFFTSIQTHHESKELPIRHITRKSTTEVVQSTGFDTDSPTSDISAAAQLDEVLKSAASVPQAPQETQASQAPQAPPEAPEPSEEELAARWEAELSDVGEDDLAAQWEAALDDEDMLLGDDVVPPPAVDGQPVLQSPMQPTTNAPASGLNSPFETPQGYAQPRPAPVVYTPHQPTTADLMAGVPMPGIAPPGNGVIPPYFSQKPQNPVASRGESFAEASKEGYKSPYDLPEDLSRPRRPRVTYKPTPPLVANTMPPPPFVQPPVSSAMPPPAQPGPPPAGNATAPPPAPKNFFEELPLPASRSRPATSSGRYTPNPNASAPTGSYNSNGQIPQVQPGGMQTPGGQGGNDALDDWQMKLMLLEQQNRQRLMAARSDQQMVGHDGHSMNLNGGQSPPDMTTALFPGGHTPPSQNPYAAVPGLVPPPVPPATAAASPAQPSQRLEPGGSMLATSAPVGPSAASRYSPKPPSAQAPGKPPSLPRYSPAPPPAASSARSRYGSQPLSVPGQNTSLPFQPRTSSPLAYHEKVSSQPEDAQQPQPPSLQPSVDLSPPRVHRPSLDRGSSYASQLPNGPPNVVNQGAVPPAQRQTPSPVTSRYAPQDYINEFAKRVTPTTAYAPPVPPMSAPIPSQATDPQLRPQTQSPGQHMTSPRATVPPIQTLPRPASVHGSSSPTKGSNPYAPSQPSMQSRARALSQGLDFITPNDGQEYDALNRWKGAPIFKFGFGGAVLSCFPKRIPRYSAGQTTPMIMPSPGEIKTSQLNQWLPAAETIVQHPGPLKTKSKKKDLTSWLASKIVAFENEPTPDFDLSRPESQKRHEERILLWKVVKILVENDGTLEGSPAIEKSLRHAIFPHLPEVGPEGPYGASFPTSVASAPLSIPSQPDAVDPHSVEELRNNLLQGDREKAVWGAVDRRLWGHAMIVASAMDKSIWKQVVQEFVRREIRSSGGNTESLAALYEVFAGNIEESIDELVPPSARAGHQLISKADGQGTTKNALNGLNSWRETLGLVLSNRSPEDHQALLALGRLLASYGRTEAAHICFIFSRTAVFGGADDPQANIVLLGVDHQQFPSSLLSEDAFLLTEAYEYATSVLGNSPGVTLPYLLAFKLLHAKQLADRGRTSEAQAYCDMVAASFKATTRPSPYHHQHLFVEVDELSARLRQTTTDGGSSWISKPSMEKVSGSMWARFNSFVAGEDNDPTSSGSAKAGETAEFGPFANVAGTPTVSRSPSVSDLYGSYPGNGAQSVPAGASSRYMPTNQYAPTASPEQFRGRSSLDSQRSTSFGGMPAGQRRSSTEYPSPPVDSQTFQGGSLYGSSAGTGYQPTPPQTSYMPLAPVEEDASVHTHSPPDAAPPMQPAVNGLFYQPGGQDSSAVSQSPYYQGPPGMPQSDSSYMPAATGNAYDPPSYTPDTNPAPEEPEQRSTGEEAQPKKKAFPNDDDDEDDLAARAAAIQKAENDRKADEAFRKAAEEDGMLFLC